MLAGRIETWPVVVELQRFQGLIQILWFEPAVHAHGLTDQVQTQRVVGNGLIARHNKRIDQR
jgi:hypothetical protein